MFIFRNIAIVSLILLTFGALGCASPGEPEDLIYSGGTRGGGDVNPPTEPPVDDQFLKNVVFDSYLGNLNDPDVLAAATRGSMLITDCSRFWGNSNGAEDLALLRATNPDMKIIGFFRSKTVRLSWGQDSNTNSFTSELYDASVPYWGHTTTGDTLQDWPRIANFNPAIPEARQAMLDIFLRYQREGNNQLDGVFWDYFNFSLWISPEVDTMEGEPDFDGDGIAHWDDDDELQAFQDSAEDWIHEMRAEMGEGFIQIVNGARALQDSTFAGLVDGMFYEIFPNVGFSRSEGYAQALDPAQPNNLFAAHNWPRTINGGPWLILSNMNSDHYYYDENYDAQLLNLGDYNRAVALLVGGSAVYYDQSGTLTPGFPSVELDLGLSTSGVTIDGDHYYREFERGNISLFMEGGSMADPFTFEIHQNGELVQSYDLPHVYP